MSHNILFVFNRVPTSEKKGIWSECVSSKTVSAISMALREGGNQVFPLNARNFEQMDKFLGHIPPIDLAFVIAEGLLDSPETLYNGTGCALIRTFLESRGIPSTHSPADKMEVCRNKALTYEILNQHGIPVPPNSRITFSTPLQPQIAMVEQLIDYPLFIKPVAGGNSLGIDENSVVRNRRQLERRIATLAEELNYTEIIVEKYLEGQEYTVGILGNISKTVLPPIAFSLDTGIRTSHAKRKGLKAGEDLELITCHDLRFFRLAELARRTFEAIGAADVLRLDIKANHDGQLYVIDVNGTPSLSTSASLFLMARETGLTFIELINLIVYEAMIRHGLTPGPKLEDIIVKCLGKLNAYRQEVA
ncbi:D-alanine--D-alanine ligase family protein [Calderihabitans maritimus]|uniref:ATP-grasp domain-containing protein n=1 Tax=Calderihabitans maritimus TaxID=1246530 RepID=A0A1Z5HS76_9FIRM|nr:ATP-grasp domain-containing protein [Calderihabitans maritimus]GAW92175.1 hypothetical protein KKC1_13340 [Calderihabitans maritimus]